ncbi:iron ABC transporter permease [Paenibacillus sp. FSL H3-0321]|nr:iron ABC transporter permease [Paenibacillus borealis]
MMKDVGTDTYGEKRGIPFSLLMAAGFLALVLVVAASISFGSADMQLHTAWAAIFNFDPAKTEHQIIHNLRFPRTIADVIVGCSLAMTGAIMQGTTRNPLADSGLMGISSGAGLAMALCMAFLPDRTYAQTMLYACLGAGAATGLTYGVASLSKRGMTPQRLVLAGMSVSMLFAALSSFVAIKYNIGQALAFWTAGGTASTTWKELSIISPLFAVGVLAAIALAPSVTLLSLGDDVASGLGLPTGRIKGISTLIVLVLTGLSVLIVGPISFVGLIIPHVVRYMAGVDYRYIIPLSGLYGATFMVGADLFGRLINRPNETPVGIIFAIIGVPVFLYLSRRQKGELG